MTKYTELLKLAKDAKKYGDDRGAEWYTESMLLSTIDEGVSHDGPDAAYIEKADPQTIIGLVESETEMREKMHVILDWIDAYPLSIFPEPDLEKAALVLQNNGMTLDAISASNMRRVLEGVRNIINADIVEIDND